MGLHFGGHTTSNRDLTATNRGKLRHPSLRHVGDTRQEGFAWRENPHRHRRGGHRETAGTTSGPTRQRTRRRGCGGRRRDTGPGCGARGRWRGLAGRRVDAPRNNSRKGPTGMKGAGGPGGHGRASRRSTTTRQHTRSHRCGGRRRDRRARAGFEIDHSERSSRVAISRAAGPSGARNTSGAPKTSEAHNETRPRPVARPRPRHAHAAPLSKAARRRSAPFTTAPPAIRRSCPRDPRPRRGQPRGGRRGRGTGSRTRSRHPRCGRSGSTAGRHRARHTRRA